MKAIDIELIEQSGYSIEKDGTIRNKRGRVLSGEVKNGYRCVCLSLRNNGETEILNPRVHRLVAAKWVGDVDRKHVHHKDSNRLNNHADNLEIVDMKINMAYKTASAVIECPCCGCKINMAITGTS